MKVEVQGNSVRIMGDNVGEKCHIYIYVDESDGRDRYTIDLVKGGLRFGAVLGPDIYMSKDHIIRGNEVL